MAINWTVTQPAPSRSLDGHRGSNKFGLHTIKWSKVILDLFQEIALWLSTPFRAQVLPEDAVVDVSSTIKSQGWLETDNGTEVTWTWMETAFSKLFKGGKC